MSASHSLDFWFEFGSQYSYLSVMRIAPLAASHTVTVRWRPFLLGPIFRQLGFAGSPFVEQKLKGEYVWKDLARQARKFGLGWQRPSRFPRSAVLPARIALLAADESWGPEFCRRVMAMNFVEDREIDDASAMHALLTAMALPAESLIASAQQESNKSRLREQTDTAWEMGIFGAPMFVADGEMFWGNDRLEDALAHCTGRAV